MIENMETYFVPFLPVKLIFCRCFMMEIPLGTFCKRVIPDLTDRELCCVKQTDFCNISKTCFLCRSNIICFPGQLNERANILCNKLNPFCRLRIYLTIKRLYFTIYIYFYVPFLRYQGTNGSFWDTVE